MKKPLLNVIKLVPVFLLLSMSFLPEKSNAQAALPDSIVQQRIRVIQSMLEEGRPGARRWWDGWLIGYGAATAVQGVLFFTAGDLKTRQDMADGAATTLLGVGGQLIAPMTPAGAPLRLKNIPGGSPEDNRAKLDAAEDLLFKSCLREKTGRA